VLVPIYPTVGRLGDSFRLLILAKSFRRKIDFEENKLKIKKNTAIKVFKELHRIERKTSFLLRKKGPNIGVRTAEYIKNGEETK